MLFMVRHTHSKLQDRVVYHQGTDSTLQEAISYINGKASGVKLGEKHASAASLLNEFSEKHPNKHTPSQQTVYQHLKDKDAKTKAQMAVDRQLLNAVEEATLVSFVQTLAAHAFPLGHQKIMCYALEIAHIWNPSCEKIGESWFCHFQSCHSEKLKAAWTKSLDTSCAAAVNPTTITHYFQLLKAMLDNFNFVPKEIYGFDESGFPFGGDGINEHVYGGSEGVQHKQGEANKENVSVMVTICADGTYMTPTTIFKGVHFNSAWAEALSRSAPGCVTRHTHHASVTHFRPILGNIVEVTLMTPPIMYINSHAKETYFP